LVGFREVDYCGSVGATRLERKGGYILTTEWVDGCPVITQGTAKHTGVCIGELAPTTLKPTNPKDLMGSKKVSMSFVPMNVMLEASLGLAEGGYKYGKHNYRGCGVRASIYYDALMRHIGWWWEGQDIDPESGINHIGKAISDLIVLRDSMMRGNWTDDRPPKTDTALMDAMNKQFQEIQERHKDKNPKHYFEKELI